LNTPDDVSPAKISIGFVLLLNSLLSLSITFVVLKEIHSSLGNLKNDRQESIEFERDLKAEGNSFSYLILNVPLIKRH